MENGILLLALQMRHILASLDKIVESKAELGLLGRGQLIVRISGAY